MMLCSLSALVSSDSEWRLLSRPLYADRLFLRLSWSQPEPTDTGGLTWNTEWMSTTATSVGTTSGNACADPLAATRMEPKASMRASGLREQSRREQGGR